MMNNRKLLDFERGPIRPPSESRSLLFRVVRNCPWNRCTFCPVYKNTQFQIRRPGDVIKDINSASSMIDDIRSLSRQKGFEGKVPRSLLSDLLGRGDITNAYQSVAVWLHCDNGSIFLQDADPLIIKPDHTLQILDALRNKIPDIKRITAYARSTTTARLGVKTLERFRQAGLTRVHTGLESGSSAVLDMTRKGMTPKQHIEGAQAVKQAGLELSLYVMPGLGGRTLSEQHAKETAKVISKIEPDFVRLRSLAVPPNTPLWDQWRNGEFLNMNDLEILSEIRDFINELSMESGRLESDHILNLLGELHGNFPDDKEKMLDMIDAIFSLSESDRHTYSIGKRLGLFQSIDDLDDQNRHQKVKNIIRHFQADGVSPEEIVSDVKNRYI